MKKLGEEYELHVFPGTFQIPGTNISKYSSKYPHNLQLLRDSIFYDCPNVIIHFPFNDETKSKFSFSLFACFGRSYPVIISKKI